ncbi:hypothetical protein [Actinosynnema sp. NPDC020468]|uniref:hypothetical protein n=1 Tax=Actinosynnema sp. NPDC020468 TaxID=3154488 RepID=UPI0033F0E8FA
MATSQNPFGGPDASSWRWEQALRIFSDGDGGVYPPMPFRETITATTWIKSDVFRRPRGPANHFPGNPWTVEAMTRYTSYYGVGDATDEVEKAMQPFYATMNKIRGAVVEDISTVGQAKSFTPAAALLEGTATWLTAQVGPLESWRGRVGHPGDDFQGTGAAAFWHVLDDLAFRCGDLVAQTTKVLPAWKALTEAGDTLLAAIRILDHGYLMWSGSGGNDAMHAYDTGLGFSITAPGSQLMWPAGAVTAIWTSPQLVADFRSHGPVNYDHDDETYPESTILGGKVTDGAVWRRLEEAAKLVWVDHQVRQLDTAAAGALNLLIPGYAYAADRLPTVITPKRLVLPPTAPPAPGPGTGDDVPGPPTDDPAPPVVVPPPTLVKKPPGTGPLTRNNPLVNPGGTGGPTLAPDLVVPQGSHVGPDGTVLGPDGKPVLGPDGRPIIVPPGSRVGPTGLILGPTGGRLDQNDRLRKAYPVEGLAPPEDGSALERHLQSLRRAPSAITAPRPPDGVTSLTTGLLDPAGYHRGPGPIGGGRIGLPPTTTSVTPPVTSPSTPVPTVGGPKVGPQGTGGVPFSPPTAGGPGLGGERKGERDRATWLAEDEQTWGTDPAVAPGVLGHRRRRTRRSGGVTTVVSPTADHTRALDGPTTGVGTAPG